MEKKSAPFIRRGLMLKRKDWSNAAIIRLLKTPDRVLKVKNKEGKEREVEQYARERVEKIESSGQLAAFNERRKARLAKN